MNYKKFEISVTAEKRPGVTDITFITDCAMVKIGKIVTLYHIHDDIDDKTFICEFDVTTMNFSFKGIYIDQLSEPIINTWKRRDKFMETIKIVCEIQYKKGFYTEEK